MRGPIFNLFILGPAARSHRRDRMTTDGVIGVMCRSSEHARRGVVKKARHYFSSTRRPTFLPTYTCTVDLLGYKTWNLEHRTLEFLVVDLFAAVWSSLRTQKAKSSPKRSCDGGDGQEGYTRRAARKIERYGRWTNGTRKIDGIAAGLGSARFFPSSHD